VRRKLVLFDIDGTILLTAGAGRRAIVAAIGEAVGDSTAFDRVRFDGKTDPQIVAELLEAGGDRGPHSSDRVSAICRRYVDLLTRELARSRSRTTLMPGVSPLLDRLESEDGVVLGLLTGNIAEGATLKLRSAGLDPGRFRVGAFGSDAAHRPELPPIAAQRARPFFGKVWGVHRRPSSGGGNGWLLGLRSGGLRPSRGLRRPERHRPRPRRHSAVIVRLVW